MTGDEHDQEPKPEPDRWTALATEALGFPALLVACMAVGHGLGRLVDRGFGTAPRGWIAGCLLGAAAALANAIRIGLKQR